MSIRLIQDLHAGISRRDWHAVEVAANRLRDDVEKTVVILAGTGIGSLPNDYPLPKLAADATSPAPQPRAQRHTFEVPEGFEAVRDAHGRATGELRSKSPAPQPLHDVPCLINPEPESPLIDAADECFDESHRLATHYMDALTAILLEEDAAVIHRIADRALGSHPGTREAAEG